MSGLSATCCGNTTFLTSPQSSIQTIPGQSSFSPDRRRSPLYLVAIDAPNSREISGRHKVVAAMPIMCMAQPANRPGRGSPTAGCNLPGRFREERPDVMFELYPLPDTTLLSGDHHHQSTRRRRAPRRRTTPGWTCRSKDYETL